MYHDNVWEEIHARNTWGKYPCEELVRFIGKTYRDISRTERSGIRVLDLGCGQGSNLWFLSREGFDVYGLDVSPSAIQKAREFLRWEWNIESVSLQTGDIRDLPYDDNTFDLIVDVATTWYISYEEHRQLYRAILRILKPGGIFWTMHVAEGSSGVESGEEVERRTYRNITAGLLQNPGITCILAEDDVKCLLTDAGFSMNHIEKYMRTYENQNGTLACWIADAHKPIR